MEKKRMIRNKWHLFHWKEWNDRIFKNYITADNIVGKGKPKVYDRVWTFDEETGEPTEYNVQPKETQRVIFIEKGNKSYMLPVIFENELPLKPKTSFDCLEKKSNKEVYTFITSVTSVSLPSDPCDKTFRQFIDGFNPKKHTNPLHDTLMKLLAFSSAYKGVGVCACSEPEFGKGVNFNLLKGMGRKCIFVTDPTKAFLYQALLTNQQVVFDEMTTCNTTALREIETTIKKLKDNTPELPKQALIYGNQSSSADLRMISTIFTYNRPQDLKDKEKSFEKIWGNPGAIFSRLPRFLFEGRVAESINNPSKAEINECLSIEDEFFKENIKMCTHWCDNLHTLLKGWDRSILELKGRHYTNAEGWIDAIEAYSKTEEEFQEHLRELNLMQDNYKKMLRGEQLKEERDDVSEPFGKYAQGVEEDII